jgi:hypothetical protein
MHLEAVLLLAVQQGELLLEVAQQPVALHQWQFLHQFEYHFLVPLVLLQWLVSPDLEWFQVLLSHVLRATFLHFQ